MAESCAADHAIFRLNGTLVKSEFVRKIALGITCRRQIKPLVFHTAQMAGTVKAAGKVCGKNISLECRAFVCYNQRRKI